MSLHRNVATGLPAGMMALLLVGTLGCGANPGPYSNGGTGGNYSSAQPVSGPLIGYMWDQSSAGLRPVYGITGAASLGTPLYTGRAFAAAAVSLRRKYALFTNTRGQAFLAALPSGEPVQLLAQVSARLQAAISPSGNAAVIYAPDIATLTLLSGLPSAPVLHSIALPAAVSVQAAIVADSGLMLTASILPDGTSSIRLFAPTGTSSQLVTLNQLGGFTFLPHSTSALIADAGPNVVLLASGLGTSANITRLAGSGDGIAQPVAVAASSDGHWAVAANRQGSSVVKIDLTGRTPPDKLQCSCTPSALISLAGNSVFVLSGLSAESMSVFDGDALKPRILFMPGVPQNKAQGMLR